jgi:cytidine deaminase
MSVRELSPNRPLCITLPEELRAQLCTVVKGRASEKKARGRRRQTPVQRVQDYVLDYLVNQVLPDSRAFPLQEGVPRRSTALIAPDGRVFFGIDRYHGNPPCCSESVHVATGVACTAGAHEFSVAVTYEPEGNETNMFSPFALGRLAQHTPVQTNNMLLIGANKKGHVHQALLSSRLHWHPRKRTSVETKPCPLAWRLPEHVIAGITPGEIRAGRLPSEAVEAIKEYLMTQVIQNSTCDGKTRPARKPHAAAVVSTDGWVFGGVNVRHDVADQAICAEQNAVGALWTAGYFSLVAGFLYGPICTNSVPTSCGACREILSGYGDAAVGDTLLVYIGPGGVTKNCLLSIALHQPYTTGERKFW